MRTGCVSSLIVARERGGGVISGRSDIESFLHTHVLNKGPLGVVSPLDSL